MIQSAMMFALGAFLSGLAWLAFSVLLVRRERRLTEKRLRASISTSRTEFETERDEMRARHAVEIYRQEREVSRGLDLATAYRLETDIKERDLVSAVAELQAREEDMQELHERLAVERDLVQDLERRHAEAGTMLRAVQHALTLEVNRRTIAQEALEEAQAMADRRRLELSAVRAQNEALRAIVGDRMPLDENGVPMLNLIPDMGLEPAPRARAAPPAPAPSGPVPWSAEATAGASVVALPTRLRQTAADAGAESAALVAEAARDLHRIAGEGQQQAGEDGGDLGRAARQAPAEVDSPMPAAAEIEGAGVGPDRVKRHGASPSAAVTAQADPESRLSQALAQIRALKRANQAGE
jgi:hypothetical protein